MLADIASALMVIEGEASVGRAAPMKERELMNPMAASSAAGCSIYLEPVSSSPAVRQCVHMFRI